MWKFSGGVLDIGYSHWLELKTSKVSCIKLYESFYFV